MPRKHIIEPAHGRAREVKAGSARFTGYERGEDEPLTHRQLSVVFLASHGLRDPQIAKMLGISYYTVCTHWRHIFLKTHTYNPKNPQKKRIMVVAKCIREGIIP